MNYESDSESDYKVYCLSCRRKVTPLNPKIIHVKRKLDTKECTRSRIKGECPLCENNISSFIKTNKQE